MPGAAYAERSPASILRPYVVCSWTRDALSSGALPSASGSIDRILPDGCIDIVWDGQMVFVAGPDTRPVILGPRAAVRRHAGVRFRPGAAPAFLGLPASELRDQRIPLDDIWGSAATRRLADLLAAAESTTHACDALERQLVGSIERFEGPVDDLVRGAVSAIATAPSLRVNGLAARLGVTDRTLHRRVLAAVGYGPKVLQRVARFRRFLASAHRHDDIGLAGLAGMAGYADQAHLSRECNALAGLTPLQLVLGSDVRLVQDGLTRTIADCDLPSTEPGARS